MIYQELTELARVVRRVSTGQDYAVTVTEVGGQPYFPVQLTVANESRSDAEESPRAYPPHTLRFGAGLRGAPEPLAAGVRVGFPSGDVYELIRRPRPLRRGTQVVAYEAPVAKVDDLYPYRASLQGQGGSVIVASLPIALWNPRKHHEPRGDYEDYSAECPPEYLSNFGRNRTLVLAGEKFRVVSYSLAVNGPRLQLIVRRADD